VADLSRTEYRLTNTPVLVSAADADVAALKIRLASHKGYAVIDRHADAAAITAAMQSARTDLGATALTADDASKFAMESLQLLDMLASDHHSIYSVSDAVPTLIDALRDKRPEVASAAAGVLGKLNSPDAEKSLAAGALSNAAVALRITFFNQLAESAKRTGNSLDAGTIDSLIKTVSSDPDAKVRLAAAGALGALNVPSNQASTLILDQVK
jgi:HEAT repeat protein